MAESWGPITKGQQIAKFNTTNLPALFGEYAEALSESLSADINMTSVSIISVLAVTTQGLSVQVKYDWEESSNLYSLIVAERGSKKSQVLKRVTAPIYKYEAQTNCDLKDKISADKAQEKIFNKQMGKLETALSKDPADKDIQVQIVTLQKEIDNFQPTSRLQIIADDITTEALAQLMDRQNGYCAVVSSEGGLFDILGGMYKGGVPSLDIFLKGFTVEPVRVSRASNEKDIIIDSPNLCVLLACQPHVFDKCLENPDFLNRGLIDRFIYAPAVEEERAILFDTPPVPASLSDGYENKIFQLLKHRGKQRVMSLSSGARQLFKEHYEQVENSRQSETDIINAYMSKLAGRTARVAGVLAVAEAEEVVSETSMQRAINISGWILQNAKYCLEGASIEQRQTDMIVRRLKNKGLKSISGHEFVTMFRHKGLGLNKADDFGPVKDYMVTNNYMNIESLSGKNVLYDFNPLLFK